MQTTIEKPKNVLRLSATLFVACWIVYCASYLGRINYSAALTAIVADGVFPKSQAGLIGTVYFFCYGFGQIISGILGDKISPYKMITTGLICTSCANLLMPMCTSSHVLMSIVWGFNGISQSMLWTPILFIISNVIVPEHRQKACLYIAASFPVGSFLSYIISTLCIRFASWRFAFIVPAVIILCVLAVWITVSIRANKLLGYKKVIEKSAVNENKADKSPMGKLIISSGAAIICLGILIHGMLKDGVTSWVPTLITEEYEVPVFFSVLLSTLLPIVNLSGAWFSTKLFEKVFKDNEMAVTAFCFALSLIPLAGLVFVGKYSIVICVILFALFTSLIVAINHMFITLIPVRFAKYGKASTMGGIFNATTYIGCALSTYGFGAVSEKLGWTATVIFWLILGTLGVISCLSVMKKYKKFVTSK
ncbi:MAG: MFS transporter [Clostridia bacterium]|nr:MFS transporter [Clostridia bacterium]MBQ7046719.1 MFS transporter [Oscillospiraceae bacterium]